VPIGDYREQAPDAIWNSPAAREVRRSILDGDFRYCSRVLCPLIVDRRLPRREEVTNPRHKEIIERRRTYVPWRPRRVLMSQDRTCNLSCPSCRTAVFTARKDEQERLNALFDKTILPLLADARQVKMSGSGDPLASGHFRHVLKRLDRRDHPRLEVELQTNGLLLDRRAWEELGLEGLVGSVWVSIDAATPETYAVVRRGGELGRLLDNLAFLGRAARPGPAPAACAWTSSCRAATTVRCRPRSRSGAPSAATSSTSSSCATGGRSARPSSRAPSSPRPTTPSTRTSWPCCATRTSACRSWTWASCGGRATRRCWRPPRWRGPGPVIGGGVRAEDGGPAAPGAPDPDRTGGAAARGGPAAEERFLRHALLLAREEERGYLELFRAATGTGPSPEAFCREALQRLGETLGFAEAADWIGLADRAADRERGTAFVDLLAAQAAADARAWEPALRLAQRATARSQRSVHAHALFVRARAALEGLGRRARRT
jgi:hypothetical protein